MNDMSPRFTKNEWVAEVDETDGDTLPTSPVLTVTVHDDDENNDFFYKVGLLGLNKFTVNFITFGNNTLLIWHSVLN